MQVLMLAASSGPLITKLSPATERDLFASGYLLESGNDENQSTVKICYAINPGYERFGLHPTFPNVRSVALDSHSLPVDFVDSLPLNPSATLQDRAQMW